MKMNEMWAAVLLGLFCHVTAANAEAVAWLRAYNTSLGPRYDSYLSGIGPVSQSAGDVREGVLIEAVADEGLLKAKAIVAGHTNGASQASALARFNDGFTVTGGSGVGVMTVRVFSHAGKNEVGCSTTDFAAGRSELSNFLEMFDGMNRSYVSARSSLGCINRTGAGVEFDSSAMTVAEWTGTVIPPEQHVFDSWQESIELDFQFVFGTGIIINADLGAWAEMQGGLAKAIADASHSTYWGGIVDIRDADGNPITDYTVTSASGTDYRRSFIPTDNPVPEPGSLGLIGLGLLGLARVRRRAWRQAED